MASFTFTAVFFQQWMRDSKPQPQYWKAITLSFMPPPNAKGGAVVDAPQNSSVEKYSTLK